MKNESRKKQIVKVVKTCIRMAVALSMSFMFLVSSNLMISYNNLSKKYSKLDCNLVKKVQQQETSINTLEKVINTLDSEIQDLSSTNKSYVDQLNEFRQRKELYDKYDYAILDEEGNRTDLTYEEIKLGEDLMKELGYDPNLLFGAIMVESNGKSDAVNEYSGATGYGQFCNETAKFVWNDLMGRDNYHPEIRKDGKSNITMMAYYYDYLYSTKGNTFNVIKQYSGNATDSGAQEYLNRINSYTKKAGVTVS